MNISAISDQSWLGKILRLPLKLIPPHTVVPILQGRLRGRKWIVGSSTHGCWLGSYEYEQRIIFERIIKEGSIVFDIGAHVGFYTLLASIMVGPRGRVFAFEPVPRNLYYLKEHLRLNNVKNATVIKAAVSDSGGFTTFDEGPASSVGHLSPQGKLIVKTVALDELILRAGLPVPNYMKIDVEGTELLVLKGAEVTIAKHHPTLLLSIHGRDIREQCCRFLEAFNYHLEPIRTACLETTDEILAYYKS